LFCSGAERVPGEMGAGDQGSRRREWAAQLYRWRDRRQEEAGTGTGAGAGAGAGIRRRAGRAIERERRCRRAFPLATLLQLSRPVIGGWRLKLRGTAGAMASSCSRAAAEQIAALGRHAAEHAAWMDGWMDGCRGRAKSQRERAGIGSYSWPWHGAHVGCVVPLSGQAAAATRPPSLDAVSLLSLFFSTPACAPPLIGHPCTLPPPLHPHFALGRLQW
jgi:hypothetical protein